MFEYPVINQDGQVTYRLQDTTKPWIDILGADSYFQSIRNNQIPNEIIEFQLNDQLDNGRLKSLIERYHQIDKNEYKGLKERINMLQKIEKECYEYKKSNQDQLSSQQLKTIETIQATAQNKKFYLFDLIYLDRKLSKLVDKTQHIEGTPLAVNKVALSKLDNIIQSGADELTCALDPFNREFTEELVLKYGSKKYDNNTVSFWLWLETQNTDLLEVTRRYNLKPKEKIVDIKEGHCYNKLFGDQSGLLNGWFLYNIGIDNQLYILNHNSDYAARQERVHHSSVLNGRAVRTAGFVTIEAGKIKNIDSNSGHYAPKSIQHLEAVKALISKIGVEAFSENATISFFDRGAIPVKDIVHYKKELSSKKDLSTSGPAMTKISKQRDSSAELKNNSSLSRSLIFRNQSKEKRLLSSETEFLKLIQEYSLVELSATLFSSRPSITPLIIAEAMNLVATDKIRIDKLFLIFDYTGPELLVDINNQLNNKIIDWIIENKQYDLLSHPNIHFGLLPTISESKLDEITKILHEEGRSKDATFAMEGAQSNIFSFSKNNL